MPDRPHHSEKMKSCVNDVMGKGHDEQSAYAICTTSLQKAGEPIFEAAAANSREEAKLLVAEAEMRGCVVRHEGGSWVLYTRDGTRKLGTHATKEEAVAQEHAIQAAKAARMAQQRAAQTEVRQLHLRMACTTKKEMINGVEHYIVPCIALQEGVIHAVNAETPEFVPIETLQASVKDWEGMPLVVGHPSRDGRQISAQESGVLEERGFGFLRNAQIKNNKLAVEAVVNPGRLRALKHEALLADIETGKPIEVSVGAFVRTLNTLGAWLGKKFQGVWNHIKPDHLAFLPGGRGACSLEMGCGAHRSAESYFVTAEAFGVTEAEVEELRAAAERSMEDMAFIQRLHDHAVKQGAKCVNH